MRYRFSIALHRATGSLCVRIDSVDRTDVHGLGTQTFFLWTVGLFVNIVQPAFMIGPEIPGGDSRTDTTANTPVVDMKPGWTVVCSNIHSHRPENRWCLVLDSDCPPEVWPDLLRGARTHARLAVHYQPGMSLDNSGNRIRGHPPALQPMRAAGPGYGKR